VLFGFAVVRQMCTADAAETLQKERIVKTRKLRSGLVATSFALATSLRVCAQANADTIAVPDSLDGDVRRSRVQANGHRFESRKETNRDLSTDRKVQRWYH
jgi:hypothetical protein